MPVVHPAFALWLVGWFCFPWRGMTRGILPPCETASRLRPFTFKICLKMSASLATKSGKLWVHRSILSSCGNFSEISFTTLGQIFFVLKKQDGTCDHAHTIPSGKCWCRLRFLHSCTKSRRIAAAADIFSPDPLSYCDMALVVRRHDDRLRLARRHHGHGRTELLPFSGHEPDQSQ